MASKTTATRCLVSICLLSFLWLSWRKFIVPRNGTVSEFTAIKPLASQSNDSTHHEAKTVTRGDGSIASLANPTSSNQNERIGQAIKPTEYRTALVRRQIQREVGSILDNTSLSPSRKTSIKNYLLDQATAIIDTQELAKEQKLSAVATKSAIELAKQSVDERMQKELSADEYGIVVDLQQKYVPYSQIANVFGPDLAFQGVGLDPGQQKALAAALYKANSAAVNPIAVTDRESVDPTSGLSMADQKVLAESRSFLSDIQIAIVASDLAATTQVMVNQRKRRLVLNSQEMLQR